MSIITTGGLGGTSGSGGISGPIGITGTVGVTFGPIGGTVSIAGGTVTIANPGAASATTIIGNTVFVAQGGSFLVDVGNFPSGFGVTFGPVGISGIPGVTFGGVTATVSNFPAVQAVTFPPSLTTTIGNTVFVAQGGSFTVDVGNFPAVFGVTFPGVTVLNFPAFPAAFGVTVLGGTVTISNPTAASATTTIGNTVFVAQGGSFTVNVGNFPSGFGATFGPVGISGVPSVTFGVVSATFPLVGITGPVGVTFGRVTSIGSTTSANTRPAVTSTSSTVLAANAARKYAVIYNQSGVAIFLMLGDAAVINQGFRIANNSSYEITQSNLWLGDVNAIKSGIGSVNVDVFEGT